MTIKKEIHVSGRVQGVGYRYFAYQRALTLGITGYAKNMHDGSVKVMAQGDDRAVTTYIQQLKEGPYSARVDDIDVTDSNTPEDFKGFHTY